MKQNEIIQEGFWDNVRNPLAYAKGAMTPGQTGAANVGRNQGNTEIDRQLEMNEPDWHKYQAALTAGGTTDAEMPNELTDWARRQFSQDGRTPLMTIPDFTGTFNDQNVKSYLKKAVAKYLTRTRNGVGAAPAAGRAGRRRTGPRRTPTPPGPTPPAPTPPAPTPPAPTPPAPTPPAPTPPGPTPPAPTPPGPTPPGPTPPGPTPPGPTPPGPTPPAPTPPAPTPPAPTPPGPAPGPAGRQQSRRTGPRRTPARGSAVMGQLASQLASGGAANTNPTPTTVAAQTRIGKQTVAAKAAQAQMAANPAAPKTTAATLAPTAELVNKTAPDELGRIEPTMDPLSNAPADSQARQAEVNAIKDKQARGELISTSEKNTLNLAAKDNIHETKYNLIRAEQILREAKKLQKKLTAAKKAQV